MKLKIILNNIEELEKIFKKKIYFNKKTIKDFIQIIEILEKSDIFSIIFKNRIKILKNNKNLLIDLIQSTLTDVCLTKSKNIFFNVFDYQYYLYIRYIKKKYNLKLEEESEEKKKKTIELLENKIKEVKNDLFTEKFNIYIQTNYEKYWQETSIDEINIKGVDNIDTLKISWENTSTFFKKEKILNNRTEKELIKYIENNFLYIINNENNYLKNFETTLIIYELIEKTYEKEIFEIIKNLIINESDNITQKNISFFLKKISNGLNNRYKEKIENNGKIIYIFEDSIEIFFNYLNIFNIEECIEKTIQYINTIEKFKIIKLTLPKTEKKKLIIKINYEETKNTNEFKNTIEDCIKNKKITLITILL